MEGIAALAILAILEKLEVIVCLDWTCSVGTSKAFTQGGSKSYEMPSRRIRPSSVLVPESIVPDC